MRIRRTGASLRGGQEPVVDPAGRERRARLVCRSSRCRRPPVRSLQRHVRSVLFPRNHASRRGSRRLRQRRRPRCVPRPGRHDRAGQDAQRRPVQTGGAAAAAQPAVPQRSAGGGGRDAHLEVHRRHRTERDRRARLRHGCGDGRYRQRRLGRPLSHVSRDQPAVPQQRQWVVHRRVGVEWHRRARVGRLRLVL